MLRYTKKKRRTVSQPIQNYQFWSGTKKYTSLSTINDGATLVQTTSSGWVSALSEISKNTGNFVFEITLDTTAHSCAGFSTDGGITNFANYAGAINNTVSVYMTNGGAIVYPATKNFTVLKTTGLGTLAVTDTLAFAFNMTEGKCYIFKNGVNLGAYFGGLTGLSIYPIGSLWSTLSKITGKSKSSQFKYSYPGYTGIGD